MRGAHARARQHRDRELGYERQIDRDAVTALDAERLQHVGELIHLPIEVEIRERAAIARLTFPNERSLVPARSSNVPVDAIDARVDGPADEPLGVRRVPLENFGPFGKPLELGRKRCPEPLRILFRTLVDPRIVDVGVGAELGGRWKAAVFLKEVGNLCGWFLVSHGGFQSQW
jgi:hypothetical protein